MATDPARGDILMLGIASGVLGALVGGLFLGIGVSMIVNGEPVGWLLTFPGAPGAALPGYVLARRYLRTHPGAAA